MSYVDDLVGIWVHPDDTLRTPCCCCGVCACDWHEGEIHQDVRWCFVCVGRGHHKADAEPARIRRRLT